MSKPEKDEAMRQLRQEFDEWLKRCRHVKDGSLPELELHQEVMPRIPKEMKEEAKALTTREARFLVDGYYAWQEQRKSLENQLYAIVRGVDDKPRMVLIWTWHHARAMERQMHLALEQYVPTKEMGVWAMGIYGIGPVLSAGLLAHIDIRKAPTPGHIYSFAGLLPDSNKKWKKGEKRPFNAKLRTLCYKIGDSFIKLRNREECLYGHLFFEQKQKYIARNEAGDYEQRAAEELATKKYGEKTEAYKAYMKGQLPDGRVNAMARRWAVKMFLSHWWEVAYFHHHGKRPPVAPYAIEQLGHAHKIEVPNPPWEAVA